MEPNRVISTAWHSPQSIYSIGHRAVRNLFTVPCQVQEKIDGSFFAFGMFPDIDTGGGALRVRSKGAVMEPLAPQAMFKSAVDSVIRLQDELIPGWQYRGEVLCKPKHNALAYDRAPEGNVILFDILVDEENYLPYEELKAEGERLGLEVVPQLFSGVVKDAGDLRGFLDNTSILGGQKIEGIVIKPLEPVWGPDKKMLFAKFVSEAFKEVHKQAWGESNPSNMEIISKVGLKYGTQARWQKSLIHLKEAGVITDSPRDIGLLIKDIPSDIKKECEEDIKDELFRYAWPHISRMVVKQVPSWYKEVLMNLQFESQPETGGEPGGMDVGLDRDISGGGGI